MRLDYKRRLLSSGVLLYSAGYPVRVWILGEILSHSSSILRRSSEVFSSSRMRLLTFPGQSASPQNILIRAIAHSSWNVSVEGAIVSRKNNACESPDPKSVLSFTATGLRANLFGLNQRA